MFKKILIANRGENASRVIPAEDHEMLRDAGAQASFGRGTNLVDSVGGALRLQGHNMPRFEEAAG